MIYLHKKCKLITASEIGILDSRYFYSVVKFHFEIRKVMSVNVGLEEQRNKR